MATPAAAGPTAFSDDGRAVIERQVYTHSEKHDHITELYEIERTVAAIKNGAYKRIALQFPDELLADSAAVSEEIAKRSGQDVFVLADTSYGSCCVDEVAADHVSADLIVHYGRSCLSPTSRIPVLYVFMQQKLDIDHCKDEFVKLFPDKDQPVIIMCDVEYSYAVESLTAQLSTEYRRIIPTVIQTENNLQHTLPRNRTEADDATDQHDFNSASTDVDEPEYTYGAEIQNLAPVQHADIEHLDAEKKKGGRYFILPDNTPIEDCSIFFVGKESLTLTNIMMVHNKCPVYTYNPQTLEARKESVQVNRMLMRRYFLVQKAKDANTFGIVVGTLGVASYLNIIDHIKKVIKAAGRKAYLFVMGKLNVAKMANFMEIDCYVLVACPENSLIDSKEFYRPIVTPFELELALIRGKEWTGDYETDFSRLLPQLRMDGFTYDEEHEYDGSSDEEAHFSMVTGQYMSRPLTHDLRKNETGSDEVLTSKLTDLTLRSKETSISTLLNSTGGEYLKSRTFRGLEPSIGEDEAAEVQEGRSGIARGYSNEKTAEENAH